RGFVNGDTGFVEPSHPAAIDIRRTDVVVVDRAADSGSIELRCRARLGKLGAREFDLCVNVSGDVEPSGAIGPELIGIFRRVNAIDLLFAEDMAVQTVP